jgi:hypothetical protein
VPSVKVCLWNIQNFGQQSGKYDGQGVNNGLRNRFLARFIMRNNIDVVMIQEVMPSAQYALDDLATKLRALCPVGQKDWVYSFCACAIKDDNINVVNSNDDLIDRTGARSECYGVLWRRNQAARFTMIEGVHQIARASSPATPSPLNISQRGRPTGIARGRGARQTFGPSGGYIRDDVYPYIYSRLRGQYVLMSTWPKLGYPRTSIMDNQRPNWSRSRRPAYVVLKLNDQYQSLAPIGAYHAPSNGQLASWGAFMAGLAREIYVVDKVDNHNRPTPNADPVTLNSGFFGGDFNYSVDQGAWPSDYTYFVGARSTADTGGANLNTVPAPTAPAANRRTTVQIITGANHDQPIDGPNNDDYLRLKIDLGFYLKFDDIAATRVNLLAEIRANVGGAYNDPLVQTEAYLAHVEEQIDNPFNFYDERLHDPTGPQYRKPKKRRGKPTTYTWCPLVCGSWGGTFIDWAETRAQFAAHNITDARRAAEYIHIFISDHLPLVATFTL